MRSPASSPVFRAPMPRTMLVSACSRVGHELGTVVVGSVGPLVADAVEVVDQQLGEELR